MTEPTDIAEVCDAAADVIERDGLCQGQFWPNAKTEPYDGGGTCLVGALKVAAQDDCAALDGMEAVADYLGRAPIQWNDQPGRAASEVVDVLRAVATKHRPDAYRSGPTV